MYTEVFFILLLGFLMVAVVLFLVPNLNKIIRFIKTIRDPKIEIGDIIKATPPDWVEKWHIYETEDWEVVDIGKNAYRVRCDITNPVYQANRQFHLNKYQNKNSGESGNGYYYTDIDKEVAYAQYFIVLSSSYRLKKKFIKSYLK